MAKNYVYFQGKGNYCKFVVPDPKYNKWQCDLYFTQESLSAFKDLKLKNVIKRDDNGDYSRISRPQSKRMGAEDVAFLPPKIFDKDGNPLEGVLIGNGSDLTLKCELYQYTPRGEKGRANAIRLESIRVDNLVPYVPKKDFTPDEAKAARGLEDQPAPLF